MLSDWSVVLLAWILAQAWQPQKINAAEMTGLEMGCDKTYHGTQS